MERVERNGNLFFFDGSFTFSNLGKSRRFLGNMETQLVGIQRVKRHSMEMASSRRRNNQSAVGRGKKPDAVLSIEVNLASNEAYWSTGTARRSVLPSTAPIDMILNWFAKRWRAFPSLGLAS